MDGDGGGLEEVGCASPGGCWKRTTRVELPAKISSLNSKMVASVEPMTSAA